MRRPYLSILYIVPLLQVKLYSQLTSLPLYGTSIHTLYYRAPCLGLVYTYNDMA